MITWQFLISICIYGLITISLYRYINRESETKKESSQIIPNTENFPFWYGIIYWLTFVGMFILALLITASVCYFSLFLNSFLHPVETPLLEKRGELASYGLCFIWFGFTAAGFILKKIYRYFPRFDYYQAMRDRKKEKHETYQRRRVTRTVNLFLSKDEKTNYAAYSKAEIGILGALMFIGWVVGGVLGIFMLDTYLVVNKNQIVSNSFFSLYEHRYELDEVQQATVGIAFIRDGESQNKVIRARPLFSIIVNNQELIFSDESKEQPVENLTVVLETLQNHNIPIIVKSLTAEERKYWKIETIQRDKVYYKPFYDRVENNYY